MMRTSWYRRALRLSVEPLDDRRLPSSYTVTELGFLGNSGLTTQAYDLNEAGQVVGYSVTPTNQGHAFLWEDGQMTDLGTLGGRHSTGFAVNEAGRVVGSAHFSPTQGTSHAFLWDGAMTDLTPGFPGSVANGINDADQVVGTYNHGRAFLWDDGVFTDLGSLGTAGLGGFANDINNASQVVGASYTDNVTELGPMPHAFIWQNGVMTDLGVLPGEQDSSATAINSAGWVVGSSGTMDPDSYLVTSRSFLYDGTALTALPVPSFRSSAADINDSGQVVGTMRVAGGLSPDHAFIFEGGAVTDLNALVLPGSGLHITAAHAINNAGQIVGVAVDAASRAHGVLLTPVSTTPDNEPPSVRISDVSKTEGRSGTTLFVFTVSLSAPSDVPVTVNFATANGTAKAGEDYDARSGTLTFAAGETTKTITIVVRGDRKAEAAETFAVNLSGGPGLWIEDGQGIGVIQNDDG
jgi:probable HAF family extracellular repeat protein